MITPETLDPKFYVFLQALSALFFIATIPAGFLGFKFVYKHRNHIAVKNRGAQTVLLQISSMCGSLAVYQVIVIFNLPCGAFMLSFATLGSLLFVFVLQRVAIAYGLYVLTRRAQREAKTAISLRVSNVDSSEPPSPSTLDEITPGVRQTASRFENWVYDRRNDIRQESKLLLVAVQLLLTLGILQLMLLLFLPMNGDERKYSSGEIFASAYYSKLCHSRVSFLFNRINLAQSLSAVYGIYFVAKKMSKIEENFGLLQEFKQYLYVALFAFATVASWIILEFAYEQNVLNFSHWLFMSVPSLWMLSAAWFSIRKYTDHVKGSQMKDTSNPASGDSVESNQRKSSHAASSPTGDKKTAGKESKMMLERFLSEPELFKILERFLCLEFSIENGYFLRDIHYYQELRADVESGNTGKPVAAAKRIYQKYIANDAEMMINIPADVKIKLDEVFGAIDNNPPENLDWMKNIDDALASARFQIFDLMLRDSWRRFKLTKEYLNAISELNGGSEEPQVVAAVFTFKNLP